MVRSILNRFFAFTACGTSAGIIAIWSSETRTVSPPIISSASPSTIWTRASNGVVCSLSFCPLSKANRVTVPVFLLIMVLLTIESAAYRICSFSVKALLSYTLYPFHTFSFNFYSDYIKSPEKPFSGFWPGMHVHSEAITFNFWKISDRDDFTVFNPV